MATTTRIRIPYPEDFSDPWFDMFESMLEALDEAIYASREDRNTVLSGGGTMTWSQTTGILTWSSAINIFSPITGYLWVIPAGSVTIPDHSLFYVTVVRGPTSSVNVTPVVASTIPTATNGDAQLLIGWRTGSVVHFRDGHCIGDQDSKVIFDNPTGDGGSGVPAGSTGQLQYKNGGNFAGAANVTYDGTNLILATALKFTNGANTGVLQWAPTGSRTLTLPDVTDTILGAAATATVTNKTLVAVNNTITDTSAALGDLLKHNGTKFIRFPKGAAYTVPVVASDGSDVSFTDPSTLGNNASNFANIKTADVRTTGDAQMTLDAIVVSLQTTDASQHVLKSWSLNDSRYYAFRAVVTVTNGTSKYGEFTVKGGFTRFSGAVTQRQKVITSEDQSDAGMAVDLAINGTAIELRVTGVAATTLRWTANYLIHEAIP